MKHFKPKIIISSCLLIGNFGLSINSAFSSRVKENSAYSSKVDILCRRIRIPISEEDKAYFTEVLQDCKLSVNEENIRLLNSLKIAAVSAGFEPDHLFRNSFRVLARVGILTQSNLVEVGQQLVALGSAAVSAGFNPDDHLFWNSFPRLAEVGILTQDNLAQIIGLGKAAYAAGFEPDALFSFNFPTLAREELLTQDNLAQIIGLCKAAYAAGFKPDPLFWNSFPALAGVGILTLDNFNLLTAFGQEIYQAQVDSAWIFEKTVLKGLMNNGFQLEDILSKEGIFHNLFLNFIRQSGKYMKNNVKLFELLTPQNISSEMASVTGYFTDLTFPLYLESLYSEYKALDSTARAELIRKFLVYYNNQVRGIYTKDPGLSDAVMEEADFALIGSTELTREKYQEIISKFEDYDIPSPNFSTNFEMQLNLGEIIGEFSEDDVAYLTQRIEDLKTIINTPPETYLAYYISQFYTRFLVKQDLPDSAVELKKIVTQLSQDSTIQQGIGMKSQAGVELISQRTEELLKGMDFNREESLLELFDLFTTGSGGLPAPQIIGELTKLAILRTYITDVDSKALIGRIIAGDLSQPLSSQDSYALISGLIEVYSEIKPEATGDLRSRIDKAVELDKLNTIADKFQTKEGKNVETIQILAAKTKLDYFYGYFGQNCTKEHPEELLNERFTPLRIITEKGIEGAVYTLTYTINGKKSLLIVGIEPQNSLVLRTNPQNFTKELLDKIIQEIALKNGYQQVLIATTPAAQSNRGSIKDAIQKLIKGKPTLKQTAQKTFPSITSYDITELAIYWP